VNPTIIAVLLATLVALTALDAVRNTLLDRRHITRASTISQRLRS
jgi:hypothetical protein